MRKGTGGLLTLLLLLAGVNANDAETHGFGVLSSQASESTAGTDNGDGLAWLGLGGLQSLVDGDTGAENWGDSSHVDALGQLGEGSGLANAVLLEGSINSVSGEVCLLAEDVLAGLAEFAGLMWMSVFCSVLICSV